MSDSAKASSKGRVKAGPHRRTARLAAVQALYEIDISGAPVENVLREFKKSRWRGMIDSDEEGGTGDLAWPNFALFRTLVRGVTEDSDNLDGLIDPVLDEDMKMERLESLLKCILRAAASELANQNNDVPDRIVISEYVDITHAFFPSGETALVNGVLDRLARNLHHKEA